jgi:multiple sugar transport system ATP-binding protein
LSGGERQRVAVGRAIVRDPAVFLFDEPLSNLDAKLRVAMRTELVKLQERLETTMVYVTHDQVEAMMMGHRVAVMHAGRVLQIGSPQQVYHSPANRFVAEFIGTPPMNLWEATLRTDGDTLRLQLAAGELSLPRSGWSQLASVGNRGVILGVRPEDITVVSDGGRSADAWSLPGTVSAVHSLGPETILEIDCAPAGTFSARVGARSNIARRDRVTAVIDPSKLHVFDRETGARI